MDYIPPSMFQLFDQTSAEELHQMISTFACKLDPKAEIQEDQVLPPTPSQDGGDNLDLHKLKFNGGRRRSSSVAFCENRDDDHDENPNEKKKKKIMHRDIERRRRQEMSSLYASLRSLIPLQYLKGKRSTSDQMHEAANYIKDLQRNIRELSTKRDKLKKLSGISNSPSCSTKNKIMIASDQSSQRHASSECPSTNISIRYCKTESVEVLVNTALREGLPLARVLGVMAREGFSVASCVSAKMNDRFLHTIQSEAVSGERSMDLAELEHKLKNLLV